MENMSIDRPKFRLFSYIRLYLLVCLLSVACSKLDLPFVLTSPDGRVHVHLTLDENRCSSYSVNFNEETVLSPSKLALAFSKNHGGPWGENLEVLGVRRSRADESYDIVAGKSSRARNFYNQMAVTFLEKNQPGRRITVFFRAYNDGVAWRCHVPQQPMLTAFELESESTFYRFPQNDSCWALRLNGFTTSYEREYDPITIGEITMNDLVGLPLTIKAGDSVYMAITEAGLTDYAGMYLSGVSPANTLVSRLSPLPDSSGLCVRGTAPFDTPWRVVMLADRPGDLIESNIILNLNRPCAIDDPSWIQPGKVIFPWWPDFRTDKKGVADTMDTANQQYYIDFAAEYGIEYLEMEPPWYGNEQDCIRNPQKYDISRHIPALDLPFLIQYAAERNVGFLMWAHWWNVRKQIDEVFPLYQKWGARGVKIDFMDRDDQEMVRFYHSTLKKAAEHKLMVYYHGAFKPTGIRRTWPNLMTREAVMGLEYTKWSDRVGPEHNVTLPFTRMLAGPMDYTPGAFTNVTRGRFQAQYSTPMAMGTRSHQLAMFVVYESPLQMVCDTPGAYRNEPAAEFIRRVPAGWDRTRVLDGKIADYIVMARRNGTDWYLGAMTDWTPRRFDVPLDFLDSRPYMAEIYADGKDAEEKPQAVDIFRKKVTKNDTLHLELAPGGGCAVWFAGM